MQFKFVQGGLHCKTLAVQLLLSSGGGGALGAALPQQGRQTQLAPRLQILLGAPIFHNYESN